MLERMGGKGMGGKGMKRNMEGLRDGAELGLENDKFASSTATLTGLA